MPHLVHISLYHDQKYLRNSSYNTCSLWSIAQCVHTWLWQAVDRLCCFSQFTTLRPPFLTLIFDLRMPLTFWPCLTWPLLPLTTLWITIWICLLVSYGLSSVIFASVSHLLFWQLAEKSSWVTSIIMPAWVCFCWIYLVTWLVYDYKYSRPMLTFFSHKSGNLFLGTGIHHFNLNCSWWLRLNLFNLNYSFIRLLANEYSLTGFFFLPFLCREIGLLINMNFGSAISVCQYVFTGICWILNNFNVYRNTF